jgi:hypothetical protein
MFLLRSSFFLSGNNLFLPALVDLVSKPSQGAVVIDEFMLKVKVALYKVYIIICPQIPLLGMNWVKAFRFQLAIDGSQSEPFASTCEQALTFPF